MTESAGAAKAKSRACQMAIVVLECCFGCCIEVLFVVVVIT